MKTKRITPIKVQNSSKEVNPSISIIGLGTSNPYLSITGENNYIGYVGDRDIKRLKIWVNACAKGIRK